MSDAETWRIDPWGLIEKRSWPCGENSFFHHPIGRPLRLRVEMKKNALKAVPSLWIKGDVTRLSGWEEISPGTWEGLILLKKRGAVIFRALLTAEDNAVYHDRCAFSCVLPVPVEFKNLRIYSFLPRVNGPVRRWMAEFERISAMGFNAVHLLPLTPMGASRSPYSPKSFYGVDETWRGEESDDDFIRLICDKAQELGLKIMTDLVVNHAGIDSVWRDDHPAWLKYDFEESDGLKRNGWHDGSNWNKWEDLVQIDYMHPDPLQRRALRDEMNQYALRWASVAQKTGGLVRLDNMHGTPEDYLSELMNLLHTTFPDLAVMGEYFHSHEMKEAVVRRFDLDLLLATPWEVHFGPQLRDYIKYLHSNAARIPFHFPVTSHDSGSAAQEFGSAEALPMRYFISAFFGMGFTGMAQGGEWGAPEKIEFIGEPVVEPKGSGVLDFSGEIASINGALDRHQAFHCAGNIEFIDSAHEAILAVLRQDEKAENMYVAAANLDIFHQQTFEFYNADLPQAPLIVCGEGAVEELGGGRHRLTLPAKGWLLLLYSKTSTVR